MQGLGIKKRSKIWEADNHWETEPLGEDKTKILQIPFRLWSRFNYFDDNNPDGNAINLCTLSPSVYFTKVSTEKNTQSKHAPLVAGSLNIYKDGLFIWRL